MKIKLQRFFDDKIATLGILFVDDKFECFTCEDTYRVKKVKGKTRIPAGKYFVEFREVESKKTLSYRERFPWFKWHLQLKGVPNFNYIYIHVGNNSTHSEGCILVGDRGHKFGPRGAEVLKSAIAFKPLYLKIAKELNSGSKVIIEIEDNL